MRTTTLALLAAVTAAASFGSTLVAPSVEIRFGGSGTVGEPGGGHNVGSASGSTYLSETRLSQAGDAANYELSATASFGTLKASAKQWGLLPANTNRSRNTTTWFMDRLLLTVPGATEATYRWQPTVRLTGSIDWTSSGDDPTPPAGAELAQSIRTEGQTGLTHYPHLIDILVEGTHDQLVTLPEIVVPVGEYFNYRLLLVTFAQLRNDGDYQLTSAEADFAHTLQVVGLSVKDSIGNAVAFQVQADSGAVYDTNGINSVPEPSSFVLLVAGLAALGLRAARGSI